MTATSAPTPIVWSDAAWAAFEQRTRELVAHATTEADRWRVLARRAREVMRAYSTGFFIASRALPIPKREEVEAIYAAVRYPDEVVDTFPLPPAERRRRLDTWAAAYETGVESSSIGRSLELGVPCALAGFVHVVRSHGIPREHYRAFLDAMRRDANPRPFETLDELIDDYVYGSAVVVGYFLTYVYGVSSAADLDRALECARRLGIALQLTNFSRDVAEDDARCRLYLPLDMLREEGGPTSPVALSRVRRRLAAVAEEFYGEAERDFDAFAPDCQPAIRACLALYRRLNTRIVESPDGALDRVSLSTIEKLRALPPSAYWRIPLGYLRA